MGLTTAIKLTRRQEVALDLLDDSLHDIEMLLGGSGSGKSFIAAYKWYAIRYAIERRHLSAVISTSTCNKV